MLVRTNQLCGCIVEFEDFGGKSAAYWKSQWKLIENLEEENVKTQGHKKILLVKLST